MRTPPPALSSAPRTRSGYPGRTPPRGPSIATRTLTAHAPSAPFADAAGEEVHSRISVIEETLRLCDSEIRSIQEHLLLLPQLCELLNIPLSTIEDPP